MRAFLAFEISPPVKEYLKTIITDMAPRVSGVKWVKSEGQHITLKFFGEIEEAVAAHIREKLSALENEFEPFEATLKAVDAFPSTKRARVVVVTLEKGVDIAKAIFHDIEDALYSLGMEKEKRDFTPHITLGRRKEQAPLLDRDIPGLNELSFIVDRIVLFKSTLTPQGAIYTKVWEIGLKGEKKQ
jgi:2'-5' RNA ligase